MSTMLTIFDVSIKEMRAYGSLCFEYMDLCQHANKYKQVVLETISWTFNGIQRVT